MLRLSNIYLLYHTSCWRDRLAHNSLRAQMVQPPFYLPSKMGMLWATGAKRSDHSDLILRNLHWLPTNERLTFKLLLFTYKALNGLAPFYISELLEPYRPPRLLRSALRNLLKVPNTRTATHGNRTFSYVAPTLWNSTRARKNSALGHSALSKLLLKHFFFVLLTTHFILDEV